MRLKRYSVNSNSDMKVNAKEILDSLESKKTDKKRCTLYLSKKCYDDLIVIAEKEKKPISSLVEALVCGFTLNYNKGKKDGRDGKDGK